MFQVAAAAPASRPRRRILFSVRDSARFPAALWRRLKAAALEDRIAPIDALRVAVQQYLDNRQPEGAAHHDAAQDSQRRPVFAGQHR